MALIVIGFGFLLGEVLFPRLFLSGRVLECYPQQGLLVPG